MERNETAAAYRLRVARAMVGIAQRARLGGRERSRALEMYETARAALAKAAGGVR
jgi:hypothetical protein